MRTNEKDPEEKLWGNAINVIFPTFENGGTHVNISGVALAKYAPNRDNGVKLIQFLSSHKAQQIYAEQNFEYPVEPGLEPSDMVKSFGVLKADTLPLAESPRTARRPPKWSTASASTMARPANDLRGFDHFPS